MTPNDGPVRAPARIPLDELAGRVGETFGPSSWRRITQDQVDGFAALTGDANPIHVDPVAAAASPFGGTVVHGYFTLALIVPLMAEIVEVTGVGTAVNYGLDRLRFPAPVPVGARVRASSTLAAVTDVPGGVQAHFENVTEVEGGGKPVVAAQMVVRYLR